MSEAADMALQVIPVISDTLKSFKRNYVLGRACEALLFFRAPSADFMPREEAERRSGRLPGIGRQMEKKQKSEAKKARAKAAARKKQPVSGAARLRQAASEALLEQSENIVESLVEAAKNHIQSAKFIYELAALQEGLGEGNEGTRKLHSLVSQLSAEPEWPGDTAEKDTQGSEITGNQLASSGA
jgi:hypothetical protein